METRTERNNIEQNKQPDDMQINTPGNTVKYGRGQNPNSKKNLVSLADRTKEERIELGRKGGIKSGERYRERKTMRETLENALKIELSEKKLKELGADLELMNGESSVLSAIVAAALREAINGDTKSLQIIRDTIGEQPKTEIVQEIISDSDKELIEQARQALIS